MSIIVSATYLGGAISAARNNNRLSASKIARLLGVDIGMLHQYENGNELIPRDVLRHVFTLAVMMNEIIEKQ